MSILCIGAMLILGGEPSTPIADDPWRIISVEAEDRTIVIEDP